MTKSDKLKVAIYARVSTKDQDCERQLRDLREYASHRGLDIQGEYMETASGTKSDRKVRAEVMKLAQSRKIDAVLVTEMTRWGRSTLDLVYTLEQLQSLGVSLVATTGLTFDLNSAQGKLIAGIMASLAGFERDLIRERTLSGLAAARAKGKKLGRPVKDTKPSDKHSKKVNEFLKAGRSTRWIAKELHISKNTVIAIKKREAS